MPRKGCGDRIKSTLQNQGRRGICRVREAKFDDFPIKFEASDINKRKSPNIF